MRWLLCYGSVRRRAVVIPNTCRWLRWTERGISSPGFRARFITTNPTPWVVSRAAWRSESASGCTFVMLCRATAYKRSDSWRQCVDVQLFVCGEGEGSTGYFVIGIQSVFSTLVGVAPRACIARSHFACCGDLDLSVLGKRSLYQC